MSGTEEPTPRNTVWASVQGAVAPGSFQKRRDEVSVLVVQDDGSEVRVRARDEPYVSMVNEALDRSGHIIFQGHRLQEGDGLWSLDLRLLGPVTLTGQVSDLVFSREEETPRISFWMNREIKSPNRRVTLVPTGVNVLGPDASALSGLRAGDRVSLQARHGEDGFLAVSPVTVLGQDDTGAPSS